MRDGALEDSTPATATGAAIVPGTHWSLAGLDSAARLSVWDDSRIVPAAEWRREIDAALQTAAAAVLLVSPSFFSSEFIRTCELPALLEEPMAQPSADRAALERLFFGARAIEVSMTCGRVAMRSGTTADVDCMTITAITRTRGDSPAAVPLQQKFLLTKRGSRWLIELLK